MKHRVTNQICEMKMSLDRLWGGLRVRPPPLAPPTHTILWHRKQPIWVPTAAGTSFGPLVKGSENWFHPMWFYPKCSLFNGEFKSFIFLHLFGLGLCSHMDFSPLWVPRKGRGCSHIDPLQ